MKCKLPLLVYEMQMQCKIFCSTSFCIFRSTFTMPSCNPPTSTRCGKGFMKAETTTLLKTIEHILPIDAEAWNEVHDLFKSKHTPQGVECLKQKINKLAKTRRIVDLDKILLLLSCRNVNCLINNHLIFCYSQMYSKR